MKWYYESNGHPQGPILESELLQLKEEGKIGGTCLVWREGMEDWAPLEKVREFGPAPKMGAFGELKLPSLQKEVSEDPSDFSAENPAKEGRARLEESSPAATSHPTSGEAPSRENNLPEPVLAGAEGGTTRNGWAPKWENPGPGGPLAEFLPSVVEILFSPAEVFRKLNKAGGWGMPLAFMAILNAIGTVMVLWTVELVPSTGSTFSRMLRLMHQSEFSAAMLVASVLGSTLALPLTTVFKAGVLHALLRFGARSSAPFSTTFRAVCYAMGATSALWIVPLGAVWASRFSGQPLVIESAMLLATGATGMWSMFVLVQALACSHGVALWRAALAVLVPPFVASALVGAGLAAYVLGR
jgi:hypothetical protein